MNLCELSKGDSFEGTVKIVRKAQPGPVILSITDGSKTMDAVCSDTSFGMDDVVDIKGYITIRQNKPQLEVKSIRRSNNDFVQNLKKHSKPVRSDLSIESESMEKLKPYFLKIAERIRFAILNNQPIMIRHHCDADGITSGMMMEKAISNVMNKVNIDPNFNLYRSPMRAPFYEVTDALKDVGFTKRILLSHGQKKPLMLVMDNGSTPEDVLGLKTLYLMGFETIIIDHHNPVQIENKQTLVDTYISLHVNPFLEGLPCDFNTGMLAYEISRMIDKDFEDVIKPAVSVLTDRSSIDEADLYIQRSGKTKDELMNIGIAIDYVAYQLKFDSGAGIYEELFENPEFVNALNAEIKEGTDKQLQSTLPYLRTKIIGDIKFSTIDLSKYTLRFTYPTPGKVISLIQDHVCESYSGPVISLGVLPDMIIVRANQPILPLPKIIETLKKELPEANVDGGGHDVAGTIKFVEAHQDAIIQKIQDLVGK